ncbi:LPS assembly lipoprotein LptE [Antarctobacter heliothermus]|uniref:LPS assembly lipoprotein LptE n=1 Tax=Antarctobacter heliothermus TaxID=74033 RepID=UPI001FE6E70B|nr:LPS assembly lipoprotein LptE [Antarctobacter heliothermus]
MLSPLALVACGFTPVYGPQGGGTALQNAILLPQPSNEDTYHFNRRFEERMGRAPAGAPYSLSLRIQTDDQDIGSTSAGNTTRYRLIGRAFFSLVDTATGETRFEGRTNAFTGYSTTGSTVATRAAETDAMERLMTLLADQVIDDLLLSDIANT